MHALPAGPHSRVGQMYDEFSADYDRFVDWPARLVIELPFIERQLQAAGVCRVLDVACGTGMHAIALAQRGYHVVGADLSVGMVERARANAANAGRDVRFEVAGFGHLAQAFALPNPLPVEGTGDVGRGYAPFDAVLCLGNSLPHLLTPEDLARALADLATIVRPGGLLLIQNRNFDGVLACQERWLEPQAHREDEREWIFLRFYDFGPDGALAFNVVTLRREGGSGWGQRVATAPLWPLRRRELASALEIAGFGEIACWGDMQGRPFDPHTSGNLIVSARRKER